MSSVLVASTLAGFVMDDIHTWGAWLGNAEAMIADPGNTVDFFAALETDARGIAPFRPLLDRMDEFVRGPVERGRDFWTFSLDDGRTEVTTANRLRHIVCGQNLCIDAACSGGYDWLLFMAADCQPPADTIPKLLELDHPLVGGEVTTYCIPSAGRVDRYPFPVEEKMATAAFVMIRRDLFRVQRFRWDLDEGWSDDPCYWHDAIDRGIPTYVRTDVLGSHFPDAIGSIESRGHDRTVHR